METLDNGGFSNLADRLKAFFFPKTGGDVSGSVTATGKVKAATIEDSDGTLAALRESVSLYKKSFSSVAFSANEQKSIGNLPTGAILVDCVMNGSGYAWLRVTRGLSGAIWVTNASSASISVDFDLYYMMP